MGSALHEPEAEFDDRNEFLYFLLGLVSTAGTLLDRLIAAAAATEPAGEPPAEDAPRGPMRGLLR